MLRVVGINQISNRFDHNMGYCNIILKGILLEGRMKVLRDKKR